MFNQTRRTYVVLSLANAYLGRYDAAEAEYRTAPEMLEWLDKAIRILEPVVQRTNERPQARQMLLMAYEHKAWQLPRQKRHHEAVILYDRAAELCPGSKLSLLLANRRKMQVYQC